VSIRQIVKSVVLRTKAFRKPSVAYCAEHSLLPEVVVRSSPQTLRSLLFLPASGRSTQLNQDVFALIVNRFRPGYFLEIGANDGFTLSNTIYLEEEFGWVGLLVEANPAYEASLRRRRAEVTIAAVVDVEGTYKFRSAGLFGGIVDSLDPAHANRTRTSESIEVWGTRLSRILKERQAPPVIDFVSIDVEGAEVSIVDQLCELTEFRFTCGCIEHNGRESDYSRIAASLQRAGYRVVWQHQTQHDLYFVDARNHG
jgi:FkbM family methyltransferase